MLWLITYFTRAMQFFVQWIWDVFISQIPFVEDIINYLPSSNLFSGFLLTGEIVGMVNYWFPLDYAIICFSSWCIIACCVYSINWVLGFIPTLS